MRVTYIKTVFLVSRGLFFVVAQKLTATSPADEVHSNYTRYKLASTIRNNLAVSWVARGLFHFCSYRSQTFEESAKYFPAYPR